MRCWDTATGTCASTLAPLWAGTASRLQFVAWLDGGDPLIAAAADSKALRLWSWDAQRGAAAAALIDTVWLPGVATAVALSRARAAHRLLLAAGLDTGRVSFVEVDLASALAPVVTAPDADADESP